MNAPAASTQRPKPWHEQDEYWSAVAGTMFSARRWAMAPLEVDCALSLLAARPGARVLDLACGVGRHALELARRGYRVTGVDRTRRYLAEADARAREQRLDIEFVCEDMRTFVRPSAFDAAISLLTSFGYFDDPADEARVATNLCRSLRPGGALVIETDGREVQEHHFRERDWHIENGVLLLERRELSPDRRWLCNHLTLIQDCGRTELEYRHRLYSAPELTTLLREGGFVDVDVYGSLHGAPYDRDARRLVVVARR